MNLTSALKKTEEVLNSWGNAEAITQVGGALVLILNATTPEDRPIVMKKILKEFDPMDPRSGGNYKFGSEKENRHKMDAGRSRELEAYMNETIQKHGGQIDPVIADILSKMYDEKTPKDGRVVFFTGLIFSTLCPYNFYGSGIKVTDEEFMAVKGRPGLFDALNTFFTDKIRFLGHHDKAAYFMQLMKGMNEKERMIALGIILDVCEKKGKVDARKERPSGMPASLAMLMNAIAGAHRPGMPPNFLFGGKSIYDAKGDDCDCAECRAERKPC